MVVGKVGPVVSGCNPIDGKHEQKMKGTLVCQPMVSTKIYNH